MNTGSPRIETLRFENAELHARLEEAEETLAAIRRGDVDALVVGDDVYVLDSANAANNKLRKDVLAQIEDAVLAFDNDDHVMFMNAAAERQYRRSVSETLGHSKLELYAETWPDSGLEAASRQHLETTGAYRAHTIHRRNDGGAMHVESTVSRLRDADGRPSGTLAVIRDISERVAAEQTLRAATEALARRERQFSTLVENSPDILTRFDRDLRHRYVSPIIERYTGRSPSEFLGKSHAEVGMPEELCAMWGAALRKVFETGQVGRNRFSITSIADTESFFDARLVPEFGADGRVESVLSIASDVTEHELADAARRVAEEALREADRRKDEFLATLAHELRNPLAPIRNAIEIMHLTREPGVHANARSIIERQVRQMVHLVDDLLDVSRISQGKVDLRRQLVDVAALVEAAVETSRPLIDAAGHELTIRLPAPRTLMVDADVTRLTQIIANLLNNAAKYTPQGGRIEVGAERDDGFAVIGVQDSGLGIPPEMLPRVFDMFAQVDRSLERAQGGLGIGLALVKTLVELHGGSVQVQSAGRGQGSSFKVRLPLAAAAAPWPDPAAPLPLQTRVATDLQVLIVDDNVDSAESLASVLEALGYRTRTAHDGVVATRAAEAFRPAVALLDIGLPGLSGHDVARHIRAQPWGAEMLLVALSGWGQLDDRRRSKEAGFDHHFVKPVDIDALSDLLQQARKR
ncbi:MAG: PAS domain-containing protein [Caldimonas sp.]